MPRRMRGLACVPLVVVLAGLVPVDPATRAGDQAGEWRQLFNGTDLAGWDTWLARPHRSVGGLDLKKNEKGEYVEPVGLNKDPTKVFTVVPVDGKPAIRISGQIYGALTTQEEFANYHLRLEFKWGEKRWPPREQTVRDSGLLYHCVGPHGVASGAWMQSSECQIQEHDCGDFWSVANVIVDVECERGKDGVVFKKGGTKLTVPNRENRMGPHVRKSADYENPTGQWNTIEVLVVGDTGVHLVNGKPNMVLANIRRQAGDKEVPLTRGKVQIQSEGAEVYYRNIAIRPLEKIPEEYLK